MILYIGDQRMNDVEPSKRGVGMVFQSTRFTPTLTFTTTCLFGLKLANANKAEIDMRVEHAAEILQLTTFLSVSLKPYLVVNVNVLLSVVLGFSTKRIPTDEPLI